MAVDPTGIVKGHENLTAIFGRWPSFHDAEVTSIRLERGNPPKEGAGAYVSVHLFEAYREGGTVKWRNHVIVTLRFADVADVSLGGFNHQNAIWDLTFECAEPKAYRVRFQPSFGVGISFLCSSIRVEAVDRGCPDGSVYA
jgi:hypothetical protein